jgi:cold shock CspA family protein
VRRQRTGRVVAFDADRGLGEIEEPDGTRRAFHCTQVADGSRTVPVGVTVHYVLVPASLGSWEASEIAVAPAAAG